MHVTTLERACARGYTLPRVGSGVSAEQLEEVLDSLRKVVVWPVRPRPLPPVLDYEHPDVPYAIATLVTWRVVLLAHTWEDDESELRHDTLPTPVITFTQPLLLGYHHMVSLLAICFLIGRHNDLNRLIDPTRVPVYQAYLRRLGVPVSHIQGSLRTLKRTRRGGEVQVDPNAMLFRHHMSTLMGALGTKAYMCSRCNCKAAT